MSSINSRSLCRSFICAAYLPCAQNLLGPGTLSACPLSGFVPGPCLITSNGWRQRKCGPFQRLKLARCRSHRLYFTIYPLGMTPYSRRSFVDDPNYFAAVSDAISGCKWPDLSPCEGSTFKTQKRHLARWTLLLGVVSSLGEDEQLQAALTLNVSLLILREGAAKIR